MGKRLLIFLIVFLSIIGFVFGVLFVEFIRQTPDDDVENYILFLDS